MIRTVVCSEAVSNDLHSHGVLQVEVWVRCRARFVVLHNGLFPVVVSMVFVVVALHLLLTFVLVGYCKLGRFRRW